MTDLADMLERLEERRELDRLRVENSKLKRELEEERNPLLRHARYNSMQCVSGWQNHPEVMAERRRSMQNVGAGWSYAPDLAQATGIQFAALPELMVWGAFGGLVYGVLEMTL